MEVNQMLHEAVHDLFERVGELKMFSHWSAEEPKTKETFDETLKIYIKQLFPIIYSGLIFYSSFGFLYQIFQLFDIFVFKTRAIMMWRGKMVYGVSHNALRCIRALGCLIMIVNWTTLFYGLITISTDCLALWVTVNLTVMIGDSIIWWVEIVLRHQDFSSTSFLNFLFPIFMHFLIWRVKKFIEESTVPDDSWFSYL